MKLIASNQLTVTNLLERAEIRRETFYKLTNSRDVPEVPSGTRNYITNYATSNTDWYSNVSGWKIETVEDSTARFGRYIKATCTRTGDSVYGASGFYKYFIDIAKHSEFFNQTMTWSMDIKTSKNTKLNIGCEWGHAVSNIDATGNWQRFSKTFEVATSSNQKAWIFYGSNWEVGDIVYIRDVQFEYGPNATTPRQAPEDLGWSKDPLIPTQSNRYLWKFEYIYYSDGNVEVTDPVNVSIAGQNGATGPQGPKGDQGIQGLQGPKGDQGIQGPKGDQGRSQYTHIAYADNDRGGGFSQTDQTKRYIGMYQDYTATDSSDPARYHWSKWKGDDGVQGVPGKPGADGKTPYIHFAYANSADGKTNFSTNYFAGALYIGTLSDYNQNDSTNYAAYTWSRMKGEDGVIESNGENRIFYGRGDTKKGFFKNATIGTDWNGVPYGEFDDPRWHTINATDKWAEISTTDGLKLLGNSGNVPTGKWTLSQDVYITDSMADTPILGNFVRFYRTDGSFFDPMTINLDGRDPNYVSRRIPTNYGRRAIWNPEPDRESYGGNPYINPLNVQYLTSDQQIKVTAKCVPDELGNGISQYTVESTGSNPKGSFYIQGVSTAIPKDENRTWTATLKIRANKTCNIGQVGFERFSIINNVTVNKEWKTLYFNGKATGQYGEFVLYGIDKSYLSSKLIIEIAEVKICNENVPKETMKDVLLTRYWYRMSNTGTLKDIQRIGLTGAISGAVTLFVPKGKKTDAKIRLRNVSLRRGDVEIPFAPAPEDIYDQNSSKVDQDQLDQIANELRDQQDRLAQELAAKALASEVSELTTQLKNLKESDLAGKEDITKAVASLEKRLANVIPLGDMAQKLEFIDSYILQGEEGMEIGNKNSGSKVMITPNRIGFFSGGTEVASFSSGQLRINNGFFADTITVGHFMTRRHPNNQYVNGTYFVK